MKKRSLRRINPSHRYVLDGEDGSFDSTAFKACLKENDIEPPKVDLDCHGATRQGAAL